MRRTITTLFLTALFLGFGFSFTLPTHSHVGMINVWADEGGGMGSR